MWINQPSTLQPMHRYHGTNVLYDPLAQTVWFLSGNVWSMDVMPNVLSEGWLLNMRKCDRCDNPTPEGQLNVLGSGQPDPATGYVDEEFVCGCCMAKAELSQCPCPDCEGARVDHARDMAADSAMDGERDEA